MDERFNPLTVPSSGNNRANQTVPTPNCHHTCIPSKKWSPPYGICMVLQKDTHGLFPVFQFQENKLREKIALQMCLLAIRQYTHMQMASIVNFNSNNSI